MKKQLFIVLLLHCSFLSMSQDVIVPDFAFCELIGRKKDFSMQTSVSIDFGQKRTFMQDDRIRNEETGELKARFRVHYQIDGSDNFKHWILKRRLSEAEKKDYKAIKE